MQHNVTTTAAKGLLSVVAAAADAVCDAADVLNRPITVSGPTTDVALLRELVTDEGLLAIQGADPSAVGDGRSALSLAVEKAPSAIVSTLLEKATPKQRVAAARTLCKGGSSALDVRKAAGKGLELDAKVWLEQAQRVAGVPSDAAPGSRVELQQRSGDGAARMLVRREGGWCGESGTVCDLADEVLGQYPLAVLTHRPQNRDLRRKSPP